MVASKHELFSSFSGGQFDPVYTGQFDPELSGQFKPEWSGQFHRILHLLYNYLTSEEFKSVFESILDGFKSLQDAHNDEKRKLQLLWKRREKHLEQVLGSTIEFYGSIKSISENSIPIIPMLEFPKAS